MIEETQTKPFNWTSGGCLPYVTDVFLYTAQDGTQFQRTEGREIDPNRFEDAQKRNLEHIKNCFDNLRNSGGYLLVIGTESFSDCRTIKADGRFHLRDIGHLDHWSEERLRAYSTENKVNLVTQGQVKDIVETLNREGKIESIKYPLQWGWYYVSDRAESFLFEVKKQGEKP